MARLLGIDVGTSGCKVLLIDESGQVLKQAHREYPLSSPQPMWSEQNPEDWWAGVAACIEEIGDRPDAIGLTGQMHGSVFLNAKDEVVRPAILWNDQRTAEECQEIDRVVGKDVVRTITGNPPLTGFQLPKVLWLRNHELSSYGEVRSVLLPKDYIRFRLTGEKATDVSDASGTGLFDVGNRRWSAEMAAKLELDLSWFPRSVESIEVTGKTLHVAGLPAGIPVVGGGGDQAAAAVGTGAVAPGIVSVSLGTSGVVFTALPKYDFDPTGAVHAFCHANGGWHAMGVMLSCGGAVRWLRDTLYEGIDYDFITSEGASVSKGCEGLTFLPYLTGERTPHLDPFATGTWAGLTLRHARAHMGRAVFEGVTFGLRDGLDAIRAIGAQADEVRVNGGGAKSAFWRQLLADVLQSPCVTLKTDEGPAFGAAILAGVGAKVFGSVSEGCQACVRTLSRTEPSGVSYQEELERFRALYQSLRGWYRKG